MCAAPSTETTPREGGSKYLFHRRCYLQHLETHSLTFITSLAFPANPRIQKPHEPWVKLTTQEVCVASTADSAKFLLHALACPSVTAQAKLYVRKVVEYCVWETTCSYSQKGLDELACP